MTLSSGIRRQVEPRPQSIYGRFRTAHNPESMRALLADDELALSLKFTAVLAAFAYLPFPLRLADFRALIPDAFWAEHLRFSYSQFSSGPPLVEYHAGEWPYYLGLGPSRSRYGLHGVHFVASSSLMPTSDQAHGYFEPPLEAVVIRFTLCHPFLQPEMHDHEGIYLFTSA